MSPNREGQRYGRRKAPSVAENCLASFGSPEALLPLACETRWNDKPSIPLGFWNRMTKSGRIWVFINALCFFCDYSLIS